MNPGLPLPPHRRPGLGQISEDQCPGTTPGTLAQECT
uniref:Uncharacterized protein n=1 Tax=Arundo donax TaxID=35708 RepID=A0A0A9HAI8_ARUDO